MADRPPVEAVRMLLIDNYERESLKFYSLLEQCVCTHDNLRSPVGDGLQRFPPSGCALAAGQPGGRDAERFKPR